MGMDVRRELRYKKYRDQIRGREIKLGRQHIPLNIQGLFSGASGREGSVSLMFCLLPPFFSVALKRFL